MNDRVRGIAGFQRELQALEKKVQNQVIRKAQRVAAKLLAAGIKDAAPEETGATRRSVKVRAGPRRRGEISTVVEVSGGHDHPFVGFVELGTKHQAADPFVRRTVAAERSAVLEALIDGIARAIAAK